MNKFYAIILAAGLSSRMGTLKPLLPVGNMPAIRRTVMTALEAGASPVVVTGHRADEIASALEGINATLVFNPDYNDGMFTSVRAGLRALPKDAAAFFMLPADCCAVSCDTLRALISAFRGDNILYPAHEGKRGHPPLIPSAFIDGLLNHDGQDGARGYLKSLPSSQLDVPDGGILLDMDTPADYARLLERLQLSSAPPEAEQYALLREFDTPEHIITHCEEVLNLCVKIADEMNTAGFFVDTKTLAFAALVHDISRRENDHAARGAKLLLERGFPAASILVAGHMEPPDERASRELQILYMADKLLRRGKLTSPEQTVADMRKKLAGDPDALANMEARMNACAELLRTYQAEYGIDVFKLQA